MNFPSELKYTKDHEWIKVEGNQATIGITEFAQDQLGDIVYVEVKTVGGEVKEHEIFGTIEAVKTVSDLFMPVTGTVLELNPKLDSQPELINSDPYGDGWIIKITLADASSVDGLLSHEAYADVTGH